MRISTVVRLKEMTDCFVKCLWNNEDVVSMVSNDVRILGLIFHTFDPG